MDAGTWISLGAFFVTAAGLALTIVRMNNTSRRELAAQFAAVHVEIKEGDKAVMEVLGARIDTVESSLTSRIDTVGTSLTARIDKVESSLRADLTGRINTVETSLRDDLGGRIDTVGRQVFDLAMAMPPMSTARPQDTGRTQAAG